MERLEVLKDFGYTDADIAEFNNELVENGSFEFKAEMQTWDMVEALQYEGFDVYTEELGEDNYMIKVSE